MTVFFLIKYVTKEANTLFSVQKYKKDRIYTKKILARFDPSKDF